jgi:hypothetical protein
VLPRELTGEAALEEMQDGPIAEVEAKL